MMEMEIIQEGFNYVFGWSHTHIPMIWSFIVILGALTVSIVLSIMFPQPEEELEVVKISEE